MKDLYRRLVIEPTASTEAIRAALEAADADTRQAAEFILLDERCRPVYDRNRRLLVTIGRLRAHLGLNYTRFWSRAAFKDFWHDVAPPEAQRPGRRVDAMMIARAFRAAKHHGRRHAVRWGLWWTSFAILALTAVLAATLWQHWPPGR